MIVKTERFEFNIVLDESELGKGKTPLIFLHGFTGCAEDWNFIYDQIPVNYIPVGIDLIGHGKSSRPHNPNYYSAESIVRQLENIFKQLNFSEVVLCGYSMGGRAALSYAVKNKESMRALILESSTAGIEDLSAKKERVEFDLLLADKISKEGIESFMEYWFNTPLFDSLKEISNFEEIKAKRNQNSITGLTNMLAGFSTGLMPSWWNELASLKFPVLLITGEKDEKYTGINKKIHSLIGNSEHKTIEGCGHNVHLEKPDLFTKFVVEFLNTLS